MGKLAAFANFGFPESHAVSFAYLVYSSAWLKLHYPAAFCAGLLNAQPMGFWSPQSLVADARRHGVVVHRPHVDRSGAGATLDWGMTGPAGGPVGVAEPPTGTSAWGSGLGANRGSARWPSGSAERRPYASMEDLVRRAGKWGGPSSGGAGHGRRPRRAGPP